MNSVRVSLYPSTVLGEFAEGGTMPKRAFLVLNGGHFQKKEPGVVPETHAED